MTASSARLAPAALLREHHRRSGRRRAAGTATVLAAAVAAATTGITVAHRGSAHTADPRPATRTVATKDVAHGPADRPLDIGRVRGSLSSDTAFLTALKARVLATTYKETRHGKPLTLTSKDVSVYYAGDLAPRRMAMVQFRADGPDGEGYYTSWFVGPVGAAASAMHAGGEATTAAGGRISMAVVEFDHLLWLTASGEPFRVASRPVFAADGTVHRTVRTVTPTDDGVVDLRTSPGELVQEPVVSEGSVPHWMPSFSLPTRPTQDLVDDAMPIVHDGSAAAGLDPRSWSSMLARAFDLSALPPSSPHRLLWAGRIDGSSTGQAVVLTAPSGANVLFLNEITEATVHGQSGYYTGISTALPAGPVEKIAFAWGRDASGPQEKDPDHPPTRSVGVIGPVGAVRARMTDTTGHVLEAALVHGGGALRLRAPDTQGSAVEFLAADGSTLATAEVVPLGTHLGSNVTA